LLVEPGKPVAADVLLFRVWGDRLPQRAHTTLYSYLSWLRTVLAAGGLGVHRRSGGYLLPIASEAAASRSRLTHAAQTPPPAGGRARAPRLELTSGALGIPLATVWVAASPERRLTTIHDAAVA
jgi:hypothetical protein